MHLRCLRAFFLLLQLLVNSCLNIDDDATAILTAVRAGRVG